VYGDFNAIFELFSGIEDREKSIIFLVQTAFKKKIPKNCVKNHQLNLTGRIFLPSVGNTEVDGQGQL
jgi:hypothetical protein